MWSLCLVSCVIEISSFSQFSLKYSEVPTPILSNHSFKVYQKRDFCPPQTYFSMSFYAFSFGSGGIVLFFLYARDFMQLIRKQKWQD